MLTPEERLNVRRGGRTLGICLAIALEFACASRSSSAEIGEDWQSGVDMSGWQLVSVGGAGEALVLVRPAQTATGRRRLWVRYELRDLARDSTPLSYHSAVALQEFDCAERRSSSLTVTRYSEHNMTGEIETTDVAHPDMHYVTPDTLEDRVLNAACKPSPGRRPKGSARKN